MSRQRDGAEVSSSHPHGIPRSIPVASLRRRAEAFQGRLFHMSPFASFPWGLLCVEWGAVGDLAVPPLPVVRLACVFRNAQYIQCSLGAASAFSETAGELEEGRCLLICGPSLQAYSQIIASYRRLVLFFGLLVFR